MPSALRRLAVCLLLPTLAGCPGPEGEARRTSASAEAATSRYEAPLMTVAEARQRQARREPMLFVDVRAEEAFRAQHIRGAVNVPWGSLLSGYRQLPKDKLLLLYCT